MYDVGYPLIILILILILILYMYDCRTMYDVGYPLIILSGYFINMYAGMRSEARKYNQTRVTEQLRDLYGPLNSLVVATESAYSAMVTMHMATYARL